MPRSPGGTAMSRRPRPRAHERSGPLRIAHLRAPRVAQLVRSRPDVPHSRRDQLRRQLGDPPQQGERELGAERDTRIDERTLAQSRGEHRNIISVGSVRNPGDARTAESGATGTLRRMATARPTTKPRPSRRSIVIAFAVAIAAAGALVAVALVSRTDQNATPATTPPANITGVPQAERVLGDPKAKVELIEFADPQCPGCRYYTLNIYPELVRQYVRPGKIKMEFHGFPFIGPDSVKALRFFVAASFQNKLWQLQEAFYRNQGGENSGWVTDEFARQLASEIPGLDVKKLFADAQSARVTSMIRSDLQQVQAKGLNQTPSFLVKIGNSSPYLLSVPLDIQAFRSALNDALNG
jgi:protein-disulfide isomerase